MNLRQLYPILFCTCLIFLFPRQVMGMRIIPQHPTHTVTAPFTVQEFLHKDNNPFYLREPIAESLSKDDLPYLYDVLSNPNRRDQWHNALLALCVLEDGPSALETVLSKVTQPWDWGEHVYKEYQPPFPLNERIRYLWNISMIEPALSVPFLAPLLSPEGATAFLESWGAMPLPSNALHEIDYLVGTVQRAAAYALIYTQSPAAVTPIADELQRQAGRTDSKGYWLESRTVFMLAGTLGLYDLLQDIGWEAGMRALREGQPTVGFGIASSYVEKRILEVDAITNIGPQRFWKRVVARHYESWLGLCVLIVVAILGTLAYRRIHHKTKTLPQYTDASS